MRGMITAGAVCAGWFMLCTQSIGEPFNTWTYYECVQDCRDNKPIEMTLQQCIILQKCDQYPRPRRTYQECVRYCEAQLVLTGQTLQQCIAKYVCSQYPQR